MFNAYNRVIDVFKSEGISLGSRNKNAPEFYIWIMPLNQQGTHNAVSEVNQDIKHNSLDLLRWERPRHKIRGFLAD